MNHPIFTVITLSVQAVLAIMVWFLHPNGCRRCQKQKIARIILTIALVLSVIGNSVNVVSAVPGLYRDMFFFWECSTQNILMGLVSVLFANPVRPDRRFILLNGMVYLLFNVLVAISALFFPDLFKYFFIAGIIAGVCLTVFVFKVARTIYRETERSLEEFYSDDFNYMHRYRIRFNIAIVLGLILLAAVPFIESIYIVWRVTFIFFYIFVTILFISQSYNMAMVNNLYESVQVKEEQPSDMDAVAAARLGVALKKWVDRKQFVLSDISTESIAESLGCDIYTFREYFRQKIGEDFRSWRQKLRIEEACSIMREQPELSNEIVAEMVGINDRSNFNKTFTKIKGMSPREWRRQESQT